MSVPYHSCTLFIGSGVWLIVLRLSRWSTTVLGAGPPWVKTTKGRRSLAGGRRRCSSLPYSSRLRRSGVPPVPLQMKCEHCTRKVGASSGGVGTEAGSGSAGCTLLCVMSASDSLHLSAEDWAGGELAVVHCGREQRRDSPRKPLFPGQCLISVPTPCCGSERLIK